MSERGLRRSPAAVGVWWLIFGTSLALKLGSSFVATTTMVLLIYHYYSCLPTPRHCRYRGFYLMGLSEFHFWFLLDSQCWFEFFSSRVRDDNLLSADKWFSRIIFGLSKDIQDHPEHKSNLRLSIFPLCRLEFPVGDTFWTKTPGPLNLSSRSNEEKDYVDSHQYSSWPTLCYPSWVEKPSTWIWLFAYRYHSRPG